jgi:DNA sulfur modification protein DndC
MLAETQDPAKKRLYRDFRRRSGQVDFIRGTNTPVPGPYTLDFCRILLRRLLETQLKVQKEAPPGEAALLIHDAELHEIRRIWRSERGDWEDSVPAIVRDVLGRELDWVIEDHVTFNGRDGRLLSELCEAHDVPTGLIVRLLDVERSAHGLKRRHAVHTRLEEVLKQEWRTLDDLLAERGVDPAEAGDEVELALGDDS